MYEHKGILYRQGQFKDIPSLTSFLTNITKENNLGLILEHDVDSIAETLRQLIKQNQGVMLLAEKNGLLVGCIIYGIVTLWWSKKQFFNNLAFYVAPKYRKGLNIQGKLLELSKAFSDESQIPILISLFDATDKKLRTMKYLNYKGFKSIGVKGLYVPGVK